MTITKSDEKLGVGLIPDSDSDNERITYSRRVARYLSQFSWYYPQQPRKKVCDDDHADGGRPSLDDAWSHYEHVTLARCYVNCDNSGDGNDSNEFVRATVSGSGCATDAPTSLGNTRKAATRLYPIWDTPLKELQDFGVSQRMFFTTLLVMSGIMCLVGILNIPMMYYFWNYAGQAHKDGVDYMGSSTIRATAICDATEWVE